MAPFYGWGSTASRLEPLWGGSLLFTTKFPEIPDTHFIDLRRMKGWVDLEKRSQCCCFCRHTWVSWESFWLNIKSFVNIIWQIPLYSKCLIWSLMRYLGTHVKKNYSMYTRLSYIDFILYFTSGGLSDV